MYGVLLNAVAILIGSLLGLFFRNLLTEKISRCIETGIAFCTIIFGIKMAMQFGNVVILISCVVFGGMIGTWLDLENNILKYAEKLKTRFSAKKTESKFAQGFTTTSILFCTGAMAVIGSINSGLMNNHETLIMKSILDGITSITFAAIYGVGVAFSALPILLYQGAIAFFASKLTFLSQPDIINEISGVGGILITMIGINVAGIKKIPVGNFFPAMLLVILVASLWYT